MVLACIHECSLFFAKVLTVALTILLLISISSQASAERIRVAVASNFNQAFKQLAEKFEDNTSHDIILILGSTGKHYAQIKNAAPYDVFFAADQVRPQLLENEGLAISGSRFTYALGKIILWSPNPTLIKGDDSILDTDEFRFLAIANPKLAPYGLAAQEVLETTGHWQDLQEKLVRGENISQTFQFIQSENAQLGFVALSQLQAQLPTQLQTGAIGSFWQVPQDLYQPIEQQAVLLKNSEAAQDFLAFVQSTEGQAIIRRYGYDTP